MENKNLTLRDPINLAFLFSVLYWIYLIFTTRMIIVFDSIGYELLGKMLTQHGWEEFFRTGPNREPFYPALIAFSMGLGKMLGFSYQLILVLIQLLILFLTQILALRILRLLKVNDFLSALTILYLGISPAIVNSALSLYSEIATYPFILAIALLIYKSWLSFSGSMIRTILLAIMTGLLFVAMILNKGIFELVTPFFFFLFLVSTFFTRNRKFVVNALAYLMVFSVVFYSLVIGYKSVNKTFNNHFTITNRGAYLLYGNTEIRTRSLNSEQLFVSLANVCGEGVSKYVFGGQKSSRWFGWDATEIGYTKINELNKRSTSDDEINKSLVFLSMQKVLQNPGPFVLYTLIEGLRMFFWESTRIGFVAYSAGLTKLFTWTPFKNGLRLGMSLLTLSALVYLTTLIWRERKSVLKKENPLLFLYLCLLFIFSFICSHSLFCIITRYSLPIVPLYLIIIAYFLQRICFRAPGPTRSLGRRV